jgi:hypothetical protein
MAPAGATSLITATSSYVAFLRLATPIRPSKPEPNNQTAAGTVSAVPHPESLREQYY